VAAATRRQLSVNSWSTLRQLLVNSAATLKQGSGEVRAAGATPVADSYDRSAKPRGRWGIRVIGVRATLRQLLGNSASTVERDTPGSEPWRPGNERLSRQPEDAPEMDSEMRLRKHPPSADFRRRVGLERLRGIRGRSVKPRRWSFGFGGVSRRPLFIDVAIALLLVFGACISTGPGNSKSRRDRHRDSIRPEASLIKPRQTWPYKGGEGSSPRTDAADVDPGLPRGRIPAPRRRHSPAPPLPLRRRLDIVVHLVTGRGTPGPSTERPGGVTCRRR
jgi:hypothetical protein